VTVGVTDRDMPSGRAIMKAAQTLAIDRVTAEVVSAFDAASIPSILLKGPSIARWLYPSGGRGYVDTDLLVPAQQFAHAERVLKELGFGELTEGYALPERVDPDAVEAAFVRCHDAGRGPETVVDLHRNLPGLPPSDDLLWSTLSADVDRMLVGGVEVRVLNRAGLALHVVAHAVQHQFRLHTGEDLRRAVSALSVDDWRRVASLAAILGIQDVLGFGLRHNPSGADAANQLGLPSLSIEDSRTWDVPWGVPALVSLWSAPTLVQKAKWIRWTVFPSRAKICYPSHIREPSRRVLAAAYVHRWRRMAAGIVPATRWAVTQRRAIGRYRRAQNEPTG
jgi:Uncharacterised nucleotidyltransferase